MIVENKVYGFDKHDINNLDVYDYENLDNETTRDLINTLIETTIYKKKDKLVKMHYAISHLCNMENVISFNINYLANSKNNVIQQRLRRYLAYAVRNKLLFRNNITVRKIPLQRLRTINYDNMKSLDKQKLRNMINKKMITSDIFRMKTALTLSHRYYNFTDMQKVNNHTIEINEIDKMNDFDILKIAIFRNKYIQSIDMIKEINHDSDKYDITMCNICENVLSTKREIRHGQHDNFNKCISLIR